MTATAARRRAAVAVLCVVQFMVVLDSTITTVALDAIRVDLATDERTLQYVLSLYAAAFGGLLLFAGRATDLAGGRRIFVAGAATFTAASLLCAVAARCRCCSPAGPCREPERRSLPPRRSPCCWTSIRRDPAATGSWASGPPSAPPVRRRA
ncbi:MFS transporter [Actinomadura madurae]|uniref:MFS transporter n=1 Tax=Actinomadura madurae TaxID=1993 RepID=UPI0035588D0D